MRLPPNEKKIIIDLKNINQKYNATIYKISKKSKKNTN